MHNYVHMHQPWVPNVTKPKPRDSPLGCLHTVQSVMTPKLLKASFRSGVRERKLRSATWSEKEPLSSALSVLQHPTLPPRHRHASLLCPGDGRHEETWPNTHTRRCLPCPPSSACTTSPAAGRSTRPSGLQLRGVLVCTDLRSAAPRAVLDAEPSPTRAHLPRAGLSASSASPTASSGFSSRPVNESRSPPTRSSSGVPFSPQSAIYLLFGLQILSLLLTQLQAAPNLMMRLRLREGR